METEQKAKDIFNYIFQLLDEHGENIILRDKKLKKEMVKEICFFIDNS
jgi:hypothetical protein